MTNYILIGLGYIGERHLKAIKETGGNLLAVLNKHDSVGILDKYFPDAELFLDFEIFDRHITMLQRTGTVIHYVVVCSPNYLHDAHCRFGLRIGADVICEKPLCLNPANAEALQVMEKETGRRVWNILQLRLHPVVRELVKQVNIPDRVSVSLNYRTLRGNWYDHSWKGDENKSGGICMNIGIHFFDMLLLLYGSVVNYKIITKEKHTSCGLLQLLFADVDWFLTTDPKSLKDGKQSQRSLTINGIEFDFTDGFTDLHTESYREILAGRGFGIEDALPALRLVHKINNG